MKDKYVFLHIPKTAGSSLFAVFNNILGPEEVKHVYDLRKSFGPVHAEKLKNYKMVAGHLVYPQIKHFEKDRYSIVFLRNPVDRFISQYYYYRQNLDKIATNLDLGSYVEFYKDNIYSNGIMNVHLWHLTALFDTTFSMEEILEQAKENLSRINFIGIYEFFADSVDLLCYDCGWPAVYEMPVENITIQRPGVDEIDNSIIDRIKELNRFDLVLYEYGMRLFNEKKRSIMHECIRMRSPVNSCNLSAEDTLKASLDTAIQKEENAGANKYLPKNFGTHEIKIISAQVCDAKSGSSSIKSGGEAVVRIVFQSSIATESLTIGFSFEDEYGQEIYGTNSFHLGKQLKTEKDRTYCATYLLQLNIGEGDYKLNVSLHTGPVHWDKCFHWWEHAGKFTVTGQEGSHSVGVAKLYPALEVTGVVSGQNNEYVEF